MLRFYDGIHSDHRGLYCDINMLHPLQGEIHDIQPKPTRRYHTKYKKCGRKYRQDVSEIIQTNHLRQQAEKLANITEGDMNIAKSELEEVDNKLTQAMLTPERGIYIPHHS